MSQINDFVIKLANVNGTGSASANGLVMKTIFRMGVPVVGKNIFPSNIQGLPTWFEIRLSRQGYLARSGEVDVMVAMNGQTFERDLKEVSPGGVLIYDSTWPREREITRTDVTVLGVPLARMCNETFANPRARILMKNMAYVGALAALLDLDMSILQGLIEEQFATKKKLIGANLQAVELGFDYAREHFKCPLASRVEPMDKTAGHIMIDGNTAAALGCVYAGATVGAWYPITPSTSLMDAFRSFSELTRIDPETGEKNFCIIQAEDELAAVGMAIGANWAGARSFTPTSGPGVSLMSEFLGFAYYAEIPLVLFNIQRSGPSTGMPTRTQQSDLTLCAYASHGDTRHVLLIPDDPRECFDMAVQAFDLSDRLQTPVMVLSDLDIGMNDWMVPDLEWDDSYRPDRGKVLDDEGLAKMDKFYRYLDSDGDGITYRTYPGGDPKGAYFVRGSSHNKFGAYTESSAEYQEVLDRLLLKWDTAKTLVPDPVIRISGESTTVAIVTMGSCAAACREANHKLAAKDIHVDYMRVRAFPFNEKVEQFLEKYDHIIVVEQNRDAQLRSLLLTETRVAKHKLHSILHYDGQPLDYRSVVTGVEKFLSQGELA
ncbi:MAG: 2-oxoacid:acceptor oxidoreductase subunit alpha [Gammaproteobacteria bacterium]|jgi:2-oxoglutarate ferredoxin oxidoreductase subunit alpha|nr:2-oxoacid:acceptor oxidoreductase subunit alpha [Gammaproteobacteria bacterium]